MAFKKRVFIFRGISGSGKSTIAKSIMKEELQEIRKEESVENELEIDKIIKYCSADDFFMINGDYCYDYTKLSEAHDYCLEKYLEGLNSSTVRILIVDNTNTETWEYSPYTALARVFKCDINIIEVHRDIKDCITENKHKVPVEIIKAQYKRFKPTPQALNPRIIIVGKLPNQWIKFKRWLFREI